MPLKLVPSLRAVCLGAVSLLASAALAQTTIHVGAGQTGNASYFALAPGAGLSYRLSRHWLLRGEYEYQLWLNSPGYGNEPDHELTPNGVHVGIAYRITR